MDLYYILKEITAHIILNLFIYYQISQYFRSQWSIIDESTQSQRNSHHLLLNFLSKLVIIDSKCEIMFQTNEAEIFFTNLVQNQQITHLTQIITKKEQIDLLKQKMEHVLNENIQLEVEFWIESQFQQKEEESKNNKEDYNKTIINCIQKNLFTFKLAQIVWNGAKMVQICIENNLKLEQLIQINDSYNQYLIQSCTENICLLEKDYFKWNNMVSLNVIKNDDLKDLSVCLHEYHKQYNYINMLNRINQEFQGYLMENMQQFDIRNSIIFSIEIMLVKKMPFINQIQLLFEDSFPNGEVIGDDVQFHAMMMYLLDIIIDEEEAIQTVFLEQNSNFQTMNSNQIKKQVNKIDIKIDCKLKQISQNGSYVLQFDFVFECTEYLENMLENVFEKIKNMDNQQFIDPFELLNKNQKFIDLIIVFSGIKRLHGAFEICQYKDENSAENIQNLSNVLTLSIEMNFKPVEMKTYVGKSEQQLLGTNISPGSSVIGGKNLGNSITKKNKNPLQKNTIRNPILLNLTFCRQSNKNGQIWKYQDCKQSKKIHLKSSKIHPPKQPMSLSQFKNVSKQSIEEQNLKQRQYEKQTSNELFEQRSQKRSQEINSNSIETIKIKLPLKKQNSFQIIDNNTLSVKNTEKIQSYQNIKQPQSNKSKSKSESNSLNSSFANIIASQKSKNQEIMTKKQQRNANNCHSIFGQEDVKQAIANTLTSFKCFLLQEAQTMVKQIINQSQAFQDQNINIIQLNKSKQNKSQTELSEAGGSVLQRERQIRKQKKTFTILDQFGLSNKQKSLCMQQSINFQPVFSDNMSFNPIQPIPVSQESLSNLNFHFKPCEDSHETSVFTSRPMINSQSPRFGDKQEQSFKNKGPLSEDGKVVKGNNPIRKKSNSMQSSKKTALKQSFCCIDVFKNSCLDEEILYSRQQTWKRKWLADEVWRKKVYSTSSNILAYTENSKITSILKQLSFSAAVKQVNDCKFVRNSIDLINQYIKMQENCQLFRFIVMDFQVENEDQTNEIFIATNMIRKWEEKNSVPKTFLIGIYNSQSQESYKNQYDIIDLWLCKDQNIFNILSNLNGNLN